MAHPSSNVNAITQIEEVEVKEGETIDFVADCLANENADNFKWSSVIEMLKADANESMGLPRVWDAQQNFVDPKKQSRPRSAPGKNMRKYCSSPTSLYLRSDAPAG